MKWTAILVSGLLLGGCASKSIPNLEDVSPGAQASTAPGTVAGSGQAAQQVAPPAQQKSGPATTATTEAIDSAGGVKLTPEQRSDVEQGVRRSLPYTAEFGPMAATVSRITSKSYIVCGWVKGANSAAGYRSFLAMYVPYMRIGLLLAISGKQTEERISRRCDNEGAPLPPKTKATET